VLETPLRLTRFVANSVKLRENPSVSKPIDTSSRRTLRPDQDTSLTDCVEETAKAYLSLLSTWRESILIHHYGDGI